MVVEPNPADIDDPEKLRNLMANAARLERPDLVWACQLRLVELQVGDLTDELEKEFWQAIHVAEELKTAENNRTSRLSRTRQKYNRDGARKCIEDLATRVDITDGFRILAEHERYDLTFEAVLLRHASEFPGQSVEIAKRKLLENGVDESVIAGWLNVQA